MYDVAEQLKLKNNFNRRTKKAGTHWLQNFLKRHPRLSLRRGEGTSIARVAAFRRSKVGRFFDNLKEVQAETIPASDVYNIDETGISTVPRLPRVLAKKGETSRWPGDEWGEGTAHYSNLLYVRIRVVRPARSGFQS